MELIRSLIEKIVLTPRKGGGVEAVLYGDPARILVLSSEHTKDAMVRGMARVVGSRRIEAFEVCVPQGLRVCLVAGT